MRLPLFYRRLSLFWKTFFAMALVLTLVVGATEFGIERIIERYFDFEYERLKYWHAVAWFFMVLFPSLFAGFLFSRILSAKLEKMARTGEELASGNLKARMEVDEESSDAFNAMARAFNEMAERLQVQLHHERQLLAGLSHELRSPLARMGLLTELMIRGLQGQQCKDLLPRLERELKEMHDLVLLTLEQAAEKVCDPSKNRPVELSRMLENICRDFSQQGEKSGITVSSAIENDIVLTGHPILLHRLFDNVLANALRFAPHGSGIQVALRTEGHNLVCTVRDAGPGVPEDKLEEIFQPFKRLASDCPCSSGAGLGLTLALESALYHGGVIKARNAAPGLEITIVLPMGA